MVATPVPPLLASARALAPLITAHASEGEAARKLPDPLVEAFIDARLFQMYVPAQFGGEELDYVDSVRIFEELARADGAAGWNVMIGAGNGRYAANLEPGSAAEIFGQPRAVWAAAFPIGGHLTAVPGGFRLSGRWPYCSGCNQSTWFLAGCLVADGNHARRDTRGRVEMLVAILPRSDWRIVETWNTAGMRGTGSHDIVIDDAFVPAERTFPLTAPCRLDTPLYRLPTFTVLGPGVAAASLGIARHAIDGFIELARQKRHAISNTATQERAVARIRVSEAEGILRAARAFYYESVENLWSLACQRRAPTLNERALLRISCVNAARSAARAVDLVFSVSGSSAIQASSPIERCWRDIHTAATHATVAEVNFETTGQVLFGQDPGPVLL